MAQNQLEQSILFPVLFQGGNSFTPLSISGLQLWLRADKGTFQDSGKTTPAASDGDVVGAWEDQSGQGNDATQGTTANKPILKLNIISGNLPVTRYTTNDFLVRSFSAGLNPLALTFFAVCRVSIASTYMAAISLAKTPPRGINLGVEGAFNQYTTLSGSPTHFELGDAVSITRNLILTVSHDGTNKTLWNDTTKFGPTTTGFSYNGNTDLGIGIFYTNTLALPFEGDIMEVLFYNSALSNSLVGQVHAYLNARWAIY